jgi:hypothetical protein
MRKTPPLGVVTEQGIEFRLVLIGLLPCRTAAETAVVQPSAKIEGPHGLQVDACR